MSDFEGEVALPSNLGTLKNYGLSANSELILRNSQTPGPKETIVLLLPFSVFCHP